MLNETVVTTLILEALEELNQILPPEQQLPVSPDVKLFGSDGLLDSLGLINLVFILEDRIFTKFGIEVTLADENGIAQQNSPFRNVQTLTAQISKIIQNTAN